MIYDKRSTGHASDQLIRRAFPSVIRMMEQNLYSVDYMLLQETLLYAYLSLHNVQAAQRTSSKLQQLYDVFYENDPKTLAAKNAEITEAFQHFRLRLR